ncbi:MULTISPECIES: type II toxin-antitoxin system RelE/ParE family toxin [Rhodopseudomonas]|uniref:type II toxin-antitoxin system RelE/ParE family toxin n=1 Tax=Rhodopseudomonas TaxID=1073 RepID=UPI000B088C9E|nr:MULTISPECIES: type II toxin-antitoxin system RelE/ParE family toxin [Rhodopseudomonas]MDF3809712.1 type II toxin-antitoxin system RelE/ParE family toxin [Rhodopseudomonas sp. BAL398]WOK17541.1 type II toxin-antitoxin system RelE/ParE family toxin [Rhodopseudomonas sp. BAL398]
MPLRVRRNFGTALFAAQLGVTPPTAKILKGFGGGGVVELIEDDRSGTYRAVYTVRFHTAVYVLHVFQKKSKHGIATAQADIELIKARLKIAEALHKERGP